MTEKQFAEITVKIWRAWQRFDTAAARVNKLHREGKPVNAAYHKQQAAWEKLNALASDFAHYLSITAVLKAAVLRPAPALLFETTRHAPADPMAELLKRRASARP
jgi:phage regulator Rha-like protein